MSAEHREFRGIWIPKEVWLSKSMTALEKVVLMEIDSLDGDGGCYASNDYLAGFCQCSVRTVTRSLSHLSELGLIEIQSFNGRRRVIRSLLHPVSRLPRQNVHAASPNCPPLYIANNIAERDSHTGGVTSKEDSQVDSSSEYDFQVSGGFTPPSVEEVRAFCAANMLDKCDPELFCAHYAAQGWLLGNGLPMADWRSMARKWHIQDRNKAAGEAAQRKRSDFSDLNEGWEVYGAD